MGRGRGEEGGEEAEAAGPFPAQLLKWMALGGRWRGSKEGPSAPLEKGMPLTLKWASVRVGEKVELLWPPHARTMSLKNDTADHRHQRTRHRLQDWCPKGPRIVGQWQSLCPIPLCPSAVSLLQGV